MSVDITLRPRKYTLDELRELYSRYSTDEADVNEWISAMQITGQLARRGNQYIPTNMGTEKKVTKPYYKTYEAELAGGRLDAKYPRFGISTQIKERTRIDPTEMQLVQYMDAKGNWIDVPERPKLSMQRPRNEYEKWRAEVVGLPADIRKKYPIKVATKTRKGTQLKVKIVGTVTRYFSPLILWGFSIESMVTFGVTGKGVNPRDLEIHGFKFQFETMGNITKEIENIGTKSTNVLKSWLETYNSEYYTLLTSSVSEVSEGVGSEPLVKAPGRITEIHLLDHDAKTVSETRARASASLPRKWYDLSASEVASRFELISDDIKGASGYHGRSTSYRKLRTGQTTLEQVLKKGKEGEGFGKRK